MPRIKRNKVPAEFDSWELFESKFERGDTSILYRYEGGGAWVVFKKTINGLTEDYGAVLFTSSNAPKAVRIKAQSLIILITEKFDWPITGIATEKIGGAAEAYKYADL